MPCHQSIDGRIKDPVPAPQGKAKLAETNRADIERSVLEADVQPHGACIVDKNDSDI